MAYDEVLADRLRERLADDPAVTTTRMFGVLAFLTNGNMTVGVSADALIVRLPPEGIARALERPGVQPFVVGGRVMHNWVLVPGELLDDPELDGWLAQARAHAGAMPPKRAG